MLNISYNKIDFTPRENFICFSQLRRSRVKKLTLVLGGSLFLSFVIVLFLPWTQNIQGKGYVTTKLPGQRPQAIPSIIDGRLEKWYVREGDFVSEGDTIAFISEVKNEYFDPDLIDRTREQFEAKGFSIEAYDQKIDALQTQYQALLEARDLKIKQTNNKILQAINKIQIDSADLVAQRANLEIAENQVERISELADKGLKTLSELQEKELKLQQTRAKVVSQENKLANQRNELLNLKIELNSVRQEYADKLAKSRSDAQSAMSNKMDAVAKTSELRNKVATITQRQKFYYILAPQSGFITQTLKKGIGEVIKEGSDLATIMPARYDLAIEVFVRPMDLPLLEIGDEARIRFDGWPAIVISGWPEASTGIFPGKVWAIDRFVSDNGLYRILITPDEDRRDWPEELRVGAGANTFVLLKDVPIWYEIWRQLNGFPADYYGAKDEKGEEVKLKAPLKSVK